MTFNENGFEIVRNVISTQLLEHLKIEFEMIKNIIFYTNDINEEENPYFFTGKHCQNTFSMYSPTCFESLLIQLQDVISKIIKLPLYPSYSYARIYYRDSVLNPHKDRLSCEYSATICIDTTDIWDFHIIDKKEKENIIKLNPGDMCVYSGSKLNHWRNPYKGEKQMQCFLHYVNSQGSYRDFKYDTRKILGIKNEIFNNVQMQKIIKY